MQKAKAAGNTRADFELRIEQAKSDFYVLRLYVSGASPKSVKAIRNVKKMCEQHLAGRYELDVIDVFQRPALAVGEQIIAIPTLIKKLPDPLQKLIGDMSNIENVLLGIDLFPKEK